MLNPQEGWFKFNSINEKMEYLRNHKIISEKATEIKTIYYNGLYTDKITVCDVCGYIDDDIAVIILNGQLHSITIDYLKEMQPTKEEKKKLGLK